MLINAAAPEMATLYCTGKSATELYDDAHQGEHSACTHGEQLCPFEHSAAECVWFTLDKPWLVFVDQILVSATIREGDEELFVVVEKDRILLQYTSGGSSQWLVGLIGELNVVRDSLTTASVPLGTDGRHTVFLSVTPGEIFLERITVTGTIRIPGSIDQVTTVISGHMLCRKLDPVTIEDVADATTAELADNWAKVAQLILMGPIVEAVGL